MNDLSIIFPDHQKVTKEKKIIRVLGIDLGTTNSSIAEIKYTPKSKDAIVARCIEVPQDTLEGKYTHVLVPSIVAIHGGKIFVGEGAKRLRSKAPELGLSQNKNIFYECKNDMGILKTYHMAPEGFRSAADIGGKVLKFLYESTLEDDKTPVDRIVVTVPASFQGAQRNDTLKAANLAGLELSGGDLMDEPVSAFLDYLFMHKEIFTEDKGEPKNILIFDFGGGTCDVAIFKIILSSQSSPLKISPISVSRYHRLGGGDIDKAIVYDILIPQLQAQNNLSQYDLSYEEKKNFLEPQLLGIAEALKIGLCTEISRLRSFNKYDSADKEKIIKTQPGTYPCSIKEKIFTLKSPQITAQEFENLLLPFLDRDFLYARETEYRLTCSIFAPIQDALDRSGVSADNIDYCLMVGGSSLIPQLKGAIAKFFPKANILSYDDRDSLQIAVARGAAYHALSLAIFGRGLIQPITHDSISIKTESGLIELVKKGIELPYPAGKSYAKNYDLAIPKTIFIGNLNLKVELVSGEEQDLLYKAIWEIPGPLEKGEALCLEYRYDENQILDLKIKIKNREDVFLAQIENPLTNVVNPQTKKIEISALEESLRTGKIPKTKLPEKFVELAEKYDEIGQKEKAIDFLKRALRAKNKPDVSILNKIGILYGDIGDYDKEEKFYREAASVSSWKGSLFNLALSQKQRGKNIEAIETLQGVLSQNPEGPYFVLRALLAKVMNDEKGVSKYLKEAFELFAPPSAQSDWELGWYLEGAKLAKDQQKIDNANKELKKRKRKKDIEDSDIGHLPILTQGLKKV